MFVPCIVNPEAQSGSLVDETEAEESHDLEVTFSLDRECIPYVTPCRLDTCNIWLSLDLKETRLSTYQLRATSGVPQASDTRVKYSFSLNISVSKAAAGDSAYV